MRTKTFALGLLCLLLLSAILVSGRGRSVLPDSGFQVGERIPSIEVNGIHWFDSMSHEETALVVIWTKQSATARAVNAWLSRNNPSQIPIYSIGMDVSQLDVNLYASMDNVAPDTPVIGVLNDNHRYIKQLQRDMSKGYRSGAVLFTHRGIIQSIHPVGEVWDEVQSGNPLNRIWSI